MSLKEILFLNILVLCVYQVHVINSAIFQKSDLDLVVNTSSGLIKGGVGGRTAGQNKTVYWFRSITYAEPPVGALRFEPPVPKKRWNNIRDVSDDSPECIQNFDYIKGVEDCLYLKIYTTKLPRDHSKKQPVLVFIHGGAFFFGSPNFTESSPDYLLDEDIIVVAIQYRLGVFGFLTTGDLVIPGNNALKDLVLALKWIKNNIEAFGGDSDNITIQGQSAGSALVSYLLQTDKTKDLFHRAIMQSGTSLCLWAYFRKGREFSNSIAENLKLSTSDSRSLIDMLKIVDANILLNLQALLQLQMIKDHNVRDGLLLGPVMEPEHEGAIFTRRSCEQLSSEDFNNVPILIGHTSLEAYMNNIPGILRFYLGRYDFDESELVPIDMYVVGYFKMKEIGRTIKEKYFGNKIIAFTTYEIEKFVSDDQFERPIQKSARLYSAQSPVYYYKFSYKGSFSGVTNRTVDGVGHSEDLAYLFDFKRPGTEADYLTRRRVVKLWTNFAKTGNPTPEKDPLLQNIVWPSNKGSFDFHALIIGENLEVVKNVGADKLTFWRKLYHTYGKCFDTY